MDLQLKGKRALVSGSTAGIGLAIATRLAAEGAHVIINGRTQRRVDEAVESVNRDAPGASVSGVAADLSNRAGTDELIRQTPEIEILVNNLGVFKPQSFVEIPDSEWMRLFETNVLSGVRLCRHYLPKMLERNWGRIVFISSESAVQIPSEMIHYGMTKTAQAAVARGIAETCSGTGVTCNTVLPGPTASEGVGTFVAELAKSKNQTTEAIEHEFFEHVRPSSLLKRFIEPVEVANLVAYVCSPLSSGTTGSTLRVDGGVVRAVFA
jgi:NAD(P)-dependent dehydrogenase (short-subunit alcohol dehydrogenase family)